MTHMGQIPKMKALLWREPSGFSAIQPRVVPMQAIALFAVVLATNSAAFPGTLDRGPPTPGVVPRSFVVGLKRASHPHLRGYRHLKLDAGT